jgi:glutamine synthetase
MNTHQQGITNVMINQLLNLQIEEHTIVEYVWLGGTGMDIRSKAKTFNKPVTCIQDLPEWNYDGSSTYQASTENSEITLRPVALFRDPFRQGNHKMALCETYDSTGKPANTNFRHFASKIFTKESVNHHEPWFGIEQEYCLFQNYDNMSWPYGWPQGKYPKPQGPYYCGAGAENIFGRDIANLHIKACLYAGVKLFGLNAEVMPSQWEFQVGTCNGIETGDHLWMARYILHRIGEYFNISISFNPKPIKGDWNGSGCHTNFSTKHMREEGGLQVILKSIENLREFHPRSIKLYGEDNKERLTGKHETSSIDTFSFGSGHRGCSIRIPKTAELDGKGYFEDRRPAANIDPYVVISSLYAFAMLGGENVEGLEEHYKLSKVGDNNREESHKII